MTLATIGAACFGLVVGWITYRTLRRKTGASQLSDIATVIGAVGGAAITTIFQEGEVFGAYCIGLAVGFFVYSIVMLFLEGKEKTTTWMGD